MAKISFVTGTFRTGRICILTPGPNNVVIFDKYEVNGEDVIKAKVGLRNRRIINWTYKLLGDKKLELEDYSFHCEQCPYTATSESNLTNHKEFVHQKLRPHKENSNVENHLNEDITAQSRKVCDLKSNKSENPVGKDWKPDAHQPSNA